MIAAARFSRIVAALAALSVAGAAAATTPQAVGVSEKALYKGAFEAAVDPLRAALATTPEPDARIQLLLQKMRVNQTQRLSGKVSLDEAATLAAMRALKPRVQDPELLALADLRETTSDYFQRLTGGGEISGIVALRPAYQAAAERLTQPCLKAEALFYVGLITQVAGDPAASAQPLAQALDVATEGGCDLEASYVLRHQAVVRDAAGDKVEARMLMARSLEIRQRIGLEVYVPYSLLSLADAEQAVGDVAAAQGHRREALNLASRLDLPAQEAAAREALGEPAR